MRPAFWLAAAGLLAACGPSLSEIRKSVARSPHRALAVFPLDFRHGQKDFTQAALGLIEGKLRRDGFSVVDRRKTQKTYESSTMRGRAFDEVAQAADLAKALGAQAALVGAIDDDFDRVDKREPVYRFDLIPPPACCNASPSCPGHPEYDPLWKEMINSCGQLHRRVLVQNGGSLRVSGLTMRLRMIDAKSGTVLWEDGYAASRYGPFSEAADFATETLTGEIVDAVVGKGL